MAQDTHEQPSGIAGRYLALIIFLVMSVLAIVIGVMWYTMQDDAEEDANPAGDVSETASRISEILSDPEQFQDQDITLVGVAGEVINARTFVLVSGDTEAEELLVASTTEFDADAAAAPEQQVTEGRQIQVIGTIGILEEENRAAFGPPFEYLLDDPAFADFMGEPVMLTNLEGISVQGDPD